MCPSYTRPPSRPRASSRPASLLAPRRVKKTAEAAEGRVRPQRGFGVGSSFRHHDSADAVAEELHVEVQEQPERSTKRAQIGDELRDVDGGERLHGLQL